MIYYNRFNDTIIKGTNTLYRLRPINVPDIVKIRLKRENYFFLKDDKDILTVNEELNSKNMDKLNSLWIPGKKHLCNYCDKYTFLNCPKVLDLQLPQSKTAKISKQIYIASKRIEKYPFIECGFETNDKFCVFECKNFHCGCCNLDDEEDDDFSIEDTTFFKNTSKKTISRPFWDGVNTL